MHNNFYFLRQLSRQLQQKIVGFTFVSCFSQDKDELIIELNDASTSFFIKASLQPEFQCISFPRSFHRARKNSVDLFLPMLMKKVLEVRQFNNERSFALMLEGNYSLLFSLHGARANVIGFHNNDVEDIFRNNFQADLELKLNSLDRTIDWSKENFSAHQSDLQQTYFTLGKQVWEYLNDQGFATATVERRWELFLTTLKSLENPKFYLTENNGVLSFSLLSSLETIEEFASPIEAVTDFFIRKISTTSFRKEKASLLALLNGKIKQGESFNEKNRSRLAELEQDHHYQQWADLVMANLHQIQVGQEKVILENFYDSQSPVEIKLRKELSPQRNAEVFYRKGKNQAIEINTIKESIEKKDKELTALKASLKSLLDSSEPDEVKKVGQSVIKQLPEKKNAISLPYHEFEFKGFKILVGKNAVANDTLTLKHSYKDDLWLHAKDVPGSHVLIKYQSGKPFPKDVVEHAAGLAAWYSKKKK